MNPRQKFAEAKNYALYYGSGRDGELARFDAAVVEPLGQARPAVDRIREAGTIVLAYLSVVEINECDPEFSLLKNSDLIFVGAKPLMNREYGNYMADPRSVRWQGILYHRIAGLVSDGGYDGLFLDTIGNVESNLFSGVLRESLVLAAAGIVCRIGDLYSDLVIVQNSGLERLCLLTAGYLDSICWENPVYGDRDYTDSVAARLNKLRRRYGIKIMVLLEEGGYGTGLDDSLQYVCRLAVKNNYLIYRAPPKYTGGITPSASK